MGFVCVRDRAAGPVVLVDCQVHQLLHDLVTVPAGFALSEIVADRLEPGPSGRMLG